MPIGRPTKYNEKTIIEMYEKYNFKLYPNQWDLIINE